MATAQQRATRVADRVLARCDINEGVAAAIQLRPRGFVAQSVVAVVLGYAMPLTIGLPVLPFLLVAVAAILWIAHWREYSTLLVQLSDGRFLLVLKGWPGGVGRQARSVEVVRWERPRQYGDRVVVLDGSRWGALMRFDADLVSMLGPPATS